MARPTMRMMQEGRTSLISCREGRYKSGHHHGQLTLQVQEQQEEDSSSICVLARLLLGSE